MTLFHIWLLWTVDFALFSGSMILRLVSMLSLHRRGWYASRIFFVVFSLAGLSAGIFKLATEPTSALAVPVSISFVVLAGAFLVLLGITFVHDFLRYTAYRAAHVASRAARTASAHIAAQRYADAEVIYDKLLKRYPKSAGSWVNKGIVLLWQDRIVEALAALDQALTLDPKNMTAWNLKIGYLVEKQQYAEALVVCERALTLSPKDATAWSWKARVLERSGHLEEAIAACDQALQLNGTGVTDAMRGVAWSTKAIALNAQGHYVEALAAVEEAVRLNPRPVRSRLAQAVALTHLERPEEAQIAAEQGLAIADQMLAKHPRSVDTWQVKRDILRFLGREAEADGAEKHMHALLSQTQSTTS